MDNGVRYTMIKYSALMFTWMTKAAGSECADDVLTSQDCVTVSAEPGSTELVVVLNKFR